MSPPATRYTPRFHMPIVAASTSVPAGVITASGVLHEGIQIEVTSPPLAKLFAMSGGELRFVPGGKPLPTSSAETSPGEGSLVLETWPADFAQLRRKLPPGVAPWKRVLYLGVDKPSVRSALAHFVRALPTSALKKADSSGTSAGADELAKRYLDRFMLGTAKLLVPGGSHVGKAATSGGSGSQMRFTLRLVGGAGADISAVRHLQTMPTYGGPQWVGHPLIAAVASAFPPGSFDLTDTTTWADLISLRPSTAVQLIVLNRSPLGQSYVQPIESASGSLNLDFYPVKVTELPLIEGTRATPEALLHHIRVNLHLPLFVNPAHAKFEPLSDIDEERWFSVDPTGSIIHIDLTPAMTPELDDGSVVTSRFLPHEWVFTTIHVLEDASHPVSGHRAFGFMVNGDGTHTFYIQGADRPTAVIDAILESTVFEKADQLWLGVQQRIAAFVNAPAQDGAATVEAPAHGPDAVHDWWSVAQLHWHPTQPWVIG